jgi:hypothetical protein
MSSRDAETARQAQANDHRESIGTDRERATSAIRGLRVDGKELSRIDVRRNLSAKGVPIIVRVSGINSNGASEASPEIVVSVSLQQSR